MGRHSHLSKHLPDIQTTKDTRKVAIQKVGVSGIRIPIQIFEKPTRRAKLQLDKQQRTIGTVSMHVFLPQEKKGTHMSRFTELLNRHTENQKTFSASDLIPLTVEMLSELETTEAFLEVELDYFREVLSPKSKIRGVAPYIGRLMVRAAQAAGAAMPTVEVWTGIEMVGQTCCPCSKEISDYSHRSKKGRGAHSQHGHVDILVKNDPAHIIWFEDLIDIGNDSVSHAAYPILKRVDERHATIGAYTNPKFVEDVLRDAAVQLRLMPHIYRFKVKVTNDEVIHFHKASGEIEEAV